MKAKIITFILLAGLLTLVAAPVYAQGVPALPHAFYGTVTINGSPAPVGTKVEVRGEGVLIGSSNNPFVTMAEGQYGSPEPLEPKLIVQGDIAEGTILTFYVNGVSTGQSAEWHSGEVTELNVSATIEGSLPEGTEAPAPQPTPQPAPQPSPEPTPPSPPELAPAPSPQPVPQPPAPPVPPPPPAPASAAESINWPVLLAVLGGVAVVGVIILVIAMRRSY